MSITRHHIEWLSLVPNERSRPAIPEGVKGWGAKGDMDLVLIEGLAKEKS
jgi:hypothetical protein